MRLFKCNNTRYIKCVLFYVSGQKKSFRYFQIISCCTVTLAIITNRKFNCKFILVWTLSKYTIDFSLFLKVINMNVGSSKINYQNFIIIITHTCILFTVNFMVVLCIRYFNILHTLIVLFATYFMKLFLIKRALLYVRNKPATH